MKEFPTLLLMVLLMNAPILLQSNDNVKQIEYSGSKTVVCEGFDSLTVGGYVGEQLGGLWLNWSGGPPGGSEDAIVSDDYSVSPNNSMLVEGGSDVILLFDYANITYGYHVFSLDIYIPAGNTGYWNLQKDVTPGVEWGFQIMYDDDGMVHIDAAAFNAVVIPYENDTWYSNEIIVDIDNDWCQFFIDGNLIVEYQWTLGTFGTLGANTLGGVNFFANPGSNGAPAKAYYDNVCAGFGPPPILFEDDFEGYIAGEQLACQNPENWTTWTLSPCDDTEDAYVTDDFAYSGNNSVVIVENNDLVKNLDEYYTNGTFQASMMVYVPTGFDGYYAVMSGFEQGFEWGMEVYFNVDGTGDLNAGEIGAASFIFDFDTWILCELHLDLNNDQAEYYIDSTLIHTWQWTLGAAGGGSQLQLAAFDFFGATATTQMYFDNFMISGYIPPLTVLEPQNVNAVIYDNDVHISWEAPSLGLPNGYNIYRNGLNIVYIPFPQTEYIDMDLVNATYEYCVTAVYDSGESSQVCADPITGPPAPPPGPINLTGPYEIGEGDDITLCWEMPPSSWMQWDGGTNAGNGIGLTDGGTFEVAAHWAPEDLAGYSGMAIKKIAFFPNADPNATFTIKIWTGANGDIEMMSQEVMSYTVDEFNEVNLDNQHIIDGGTDLWIGYQVTHSAGQFPAGCDDGPAIPYRGDMISIGDPWVSMSVEFGLDYNWNIAAYIEIPSGKSMQLGKPANFPVNNGGFDACGPNGEMVKFMPNAEKGFLHFNLFQSFNSGDFELIATPVMNCATIANVTTSGYRTYYVTALWDEGESDPSNMHGVACFIGIEEQPTYNIHIFPNPATNEINIKSDYIIEFVSVYDYTGQLIINEKINSKSYILNSSGYNSGIYFLLINTTEGRVLKRIVIN